MLKKFKEKWNAIKLILEANEFYIVTANPDTKFNTDKDLAPIRYKYYYNTNRSLFYWFCKDYIDTHIIDKKYENVDNC